MEKKNHTVVTIKKSQVVFFFFFLQECNLCSFQLIFKTRFKGMSKVYIDVRMSVILTLDTDDFRPPAPCFASFLNSTATINQWVNGTPHFVLCTRKLNGRGFRCLSSSQSVHVLFELALGNRAS